MKSVPCLLANSTLLASLCLRMACYVVDHITRRRRGWAGGRRRVRGRWPGQSRDRRAIHEAEMATPAESGRRGCRRCRGAGDTAFATPVGGPPPRAGKATPGVASNGSGAHGKTTSTSVGTPRWSGFHSRKKGRLSSVVQAFSSPSIATVPPSAPTLEDHQAVLEVLEAKGALVNGSVGISARNSGTSWLGSSGHFPWDRRYSSAATATRAHRTRAR